VAYAKPRQSKRITEEERSYLIESLEGNEPGRDRSNLPSWAGLFRYRKLWGLITIKFLTDSAWFFFIFWLPKYLADARGLDIKSIGYYAWIPYAFAGVGSFCGGWLSSFLIRRGLSLDLSRKITLGIAAFIMPVTLLITNASLSFAIVFFSMAMLGHQFWSTVVQTLAADIFPSGVVGSVSGLMGAIGSFGAMLFSLLAGQIIFHMGYTPVFLIAGLLYPVSFIILLLVVKKIRPVSLLSAR